MARRQKNVYYQTVGNTVNCCTGDEILCLSLPSPVTVTLLGTELNIELPCLRITSKEQLTDRQKQQLVQNLSTLLQSLTGGLGG